jgi:hypothetical protein
LICQIVANEEDFFHTAFEEDSSGEVFFISFRKFKQFIKLSPDENEDRCKTVSRIGKISRRKCKEAIIRAQNEANSLFDNVNLWKILQKDNKNVPEVSFTLSNQTNKCLF